MTCAFLTLVFVLSGPGAAIAMLIWCGGKRLDQHLEGNPAAAKQLYDGLILPMVVGKVETPEVPELLPEPVAKPEPKKIKGPLV